MPGHASSPYWTAVDFDSEGDEEPTQHSTQRVYLDPWDSEQYSFGRIEPVDSSLGENVNSVAGEPVSASFYYVPTKNYDSEEEAGESSATAETRRIVSVEAERTLPDYSQPRRRSRVHDYQQDVMNYGYDVMPIPDRRRSFYHPEEPYYALHPMIYEPVYHPLPPPMMPHPGSFMQPPAMSKKRLSLPPNHVDYVVPTPKNGKHRRSSRDVDASDRYAYETLMAEYGVIGPGAPIEDWRKAALPKGAPDNFHLSRYGHLKIDYSCSWNYLDRLIRNQ